MFKSYRILTVVLLVILAAGFAHAEKITTSPYPVLRHVESATTPEGRGIYTLTFDFDANPVSFDVNGVQFGFEGVLPSEAFIVGLGWTDLMVDIYDNEGPTYENWASDLFLGCTFEDEDGLNFVGARPFEMVYEGGGTFGPVSQSYTLEPEAWPVPATDPFSFFASSNWDDLTGLPAGALIGGSIFVQIDSPVVANENATLGALKAMYR